MKKLYILVVITFTNFYYAQTVDFESISLNTNTAFDGSDLSGTPNNDSSAYDTTFVFSGLIMTNQWAVSGGFGYFSDGWAFSNKTADTTSGLAGAYNSYAGGGVNGSDNYAITYIGSEKVIKLENNAVATFGDISVTNNTYAAFSMLNGDPYAKQFGGHTGDDEDWFLLDIIGYDANGLSVDSIKFYLADYRFSDNSQDYIIKEWETIDLSSLGEVNKIGFKLSSSDNGNFGINTPAYIAVDDINFGFTAINEIKKQHLTFFPNPANSTITLNNSIENGVLSIFNLSGQQVFSKSINSSEKLVNISNLPTGVYTISLNQNGVISTSRLTRCAF